MSEAGADGPWALPEGWCWASIEEVVDPIATIDPKRAFASRQFHYIDLSALEHARVAKPSLLAGSDAPSRARQVAKPGDTLFSCVRVYLQNTALLGEGLTNPVASTAYCVLRPNAGVDPSYLNYFVRSRRFIEWMIPLQRGNSPPAVLDADVKTQAIPLAPLPEQRRIAARIDALFVEIAEGEVALAAARKGLETLRRALLKAAVSGELTKDWREENLPTETGRDLLVRIAKDRAARASKKGHERRRGDAPSVDSLHPVQLPDGWVSTALGELSWASSYGTSLKCSYEANGVAVLRIPNIREGEIVASDLKYATADLGLEPRDLVAPGDLFVIRTNGSETLIGRGGVAFMDAEQPTYFASYLIRFRLLGDDTMWHWISKYFESPVVRQWMTGQIASSAGQYNVSQSNLASLRVPVPPPAEAAEILRRVSDALTAMVDTQALLDAEAADAARLKQSILKAAFEGRLTEQDPADEPASALLARITNSASPVPKRGRSRSSKIAS